MTSNILTAIVAPVQIGYLTIEGLHCENGEFYVAVPQLAAIGLIDGSRKWSQKQLETSLAIAFKGHAKLKTEFNRNSTNAISLKDFEGVIKASVKKGNQKALDLAMDLVGLSLQQLFCDSFNVKFEKDDRQLWLMERQSTKHSFRPLTDMLQEYGLKDGWEYGRFVGAFQAALGIENGTRDNLSHQQLIDLQTAQAKVTTYMECGYKPWDALAKFSSKTKQVVN